MDQTSELPSLLPRTNRPADTQRHRQILAKPSLILVAKPTLDVDPPDSLPAQPLEEGIKRIDAGETSRLCLPLWVL